MAESVIPLSVPPEISIKTAQRLVEELYLLRVKSIKSLDSYDDKNYKVDVSSETDNPHISKVHAGGYVLKVLKQLDRPEDKVAAEHEMSRILSEAGITCCTPEINVNGKETSIQKLAIEKEGKTNKDVEYSVHLVRLMRFVPGIRLYDIPFTPSVLTKAGEYLGRIDIALQGFSHPGLTDHNNEWCLRNVPQLEEFVHAVTDDKHRQYAIDVIKTFKTEIVPNFPKYTKAVIHGDFNDQNILVEKNVDNDDYKIAGVIDFGDSDEAYTVMDVATSVAYLTIESKVIDVLKVGGYILKGYYKHINLNADEKEALKTMVAGRLCQTLVLGAYNYLLNPENEYILNTAKHGWKVLLKFWDTPKEELYTCWQEIIDE